MEEQRPDPDKLLLRAQEKDRKKKRGKLKIYLGAAPGVGKTHEMLHDALEEQNKGLDVVVGIAESHGRQEIESLLKNFKILPRKVIDYRGKELFDFDLDAALKQKPGLILIDEMAHSNAPNLRHGKRWQDIKELLDRGIDVYTTLNVQHIESLNDDVSQIIHAPIKETVPDSMIEMADSIELVDLPPEDLLNRLKEGKVYFSEQATLAADNFFRKGNLIALRELALRIAAEHVGAEVLLYRQDKGIKQIWPIKDKILVCVGPKPESLKLIRAAKRMANSLQTKWIAVYIDTPQLQSAKTKRQSAIQNLHFAAQLGAETKVLAGFDIVKEIMIFAREQNVTLIMIWKHVRKPWQDWFYRNLADEMLRQSGEIDVYIMTGTPSEVKPQKIVAATHKIVWKYYAAAIGIVGLATLIDYLLYPLLAGSNLIMIYLLGVTIVALFGRIGPSILASIISVVAYDFFFIQPIYSFSLSDIKSVITLLVMLLITQIISHLTIQVRRQAESARLTQHQTSALYTLSRQLANVRGIDKHIEVGTHFIAENFDCDDVVLLPVNSHLEIRSTAVAKQELDAKEQGIAQWVYELGQNAGLGTDTMTFSNSLYMPLIASKGSIGVLKIQPRTQPSFTPDQMRLIEACSSQIALALEVDLMQEKRRQEELQTAIDNVRSTLLQAISHDLRTPLIAVIASASTLVELGNTLEGNKIIEIGKNIYSETEQLSRLINNLLQITYLESNAVKLQIQPSSLQDIVNIVVKTSSKKIKGRAIHISVPENLPPIPFDNSLIQEVLYNLIDNAVKFTSAKSPIDITINLQKDIVIVSVEDQGPGIMPDEVNKLFEKYYRGRNLTSERGLGLGLAICQHIIEAHGGRIWAENRKQQGLAVRFTLPLNAR